jgi:hypothetical protein
MNKTILFHDADFSNQISTWSGSQGLTIMIENPSSHEQLSITLDAETAQGFIDEMQDWLNTYTQNEQRLD